MQEITLKQLAEKYHLPLPLEKINFDKLSISKADSLRKIIEIYDKIPDNELEEFVAKHWPYGG